jgi:hypothetical protein
MLFLRYFPAEWDHHIRPCAVATRFGKPDMPPFAANFTRFPLIMWGKTATHTVTIFFFSSKGRPPP